MNTKTKNRAIFIYLLIVLGTCYMAGVLEAVTGTGKVYKFLGICFTFIPVMAAVVTKRITGEKAKYHLSLRVWKNMKYWMLSALLPGVLIAAGAAIYYLFFPDQYSGIFEIGMRLGMDAQVCVKHPVFIAIVCILISALMFPIQLLELGEEIGWRGYLLGFQVQKYSKRKAAIINGVEWGLAHLPLVYFGFNYSLENRGAPWSNMGMMMLICIVLGIILSYVTVRTGNCMYAAIIHGVVNVIGELPVYLSRTLVSGLLGPNPTGMLAMLPLLIMAILCLLKCEVKK